MNLVDSRENKSIVIGDSEIGYNASLKNGEIKSLEIKIGSESVIITDKNDLNNLMTLISGLANIINSSQAKQFFNVFTKGMNNE